MDITKIDLNLLTVFEVLIRERNVTRAADQLRLSQPAVSAALGRLRDLLGDPLFVRTGHGMRPTARALQLNAPVSDALGIIRASLQRGTSFDPATSTRTFTIMITDIGEVIYLPRLIERVRAEAPEVRLFARRLVRSIVEDELGFGSVDLAFGFINQLSGNVRSEPLFDESFVSMVRAGHPRIGGTLTLEQFLSERHLLIARHSGMEGGSLRVLDGIVEERLKDIGRERRVAMSVPHFLAVPIIIANTDLLVSVPRRLGEVYREHSSNRLLPLPFDVPSFTVGQFWHKRFDDDSGNRWLRTLASELFSERTRPGPGRHRSRVQSVILNPAAAKPAGDDRVRPQSRAKPRSIRATKQNY